MPPIIRVNNLSKRYQLGQTHAATLGELVENSAKWLFRRHRACDSTNSFGWSNPSQIDKSGDFWALRDVSFEIQRGEAIGIIGKNGAGKSTLLKILSRITHPNSGRVEVYGRVASLLEVGTGFHPELTGRENVNLNGAILGMSKAEIRAKFDQIVAFAGIPNFIDTPVKRYSSGMYVRLAFAVAAHLDPEVLIIDEVLAVGDVEFQKKCLGAMDDLAAHGRTVIFVSHNMGSLLQLTRNAILLENGRAVTFGPTRSVVDDYLSRMSAIAPIDIAARSDRQGNGLLKFEDVTFLDERGKAVDTLVCGTHAKIHLAFTNNSRLPLSRVAVTVGINDSLGNRITHLASQVQRVTSTNIAATVGLVEIDIPRVPFSPGSYSITVFCTVQDTIADWVQNAASFHVLEGDYFGTGKTFSLSPGEVFIDHSVSILPGQP